MNEVLSIILSDTFLTFLVIAVIMTAIAGIVAFIADKMFQTQLGQKIAEKFLDAMEEDEEGFVIDEK